MEAEQQHRPAVLIPYAGPDSTPDIQDIFVYMRPETNGVLGESTILKVIERCPEYRVDIQLVYLANVPGEFIVSNYIVEHHYASKLHFAVLGKAACTRFMRDQFERKFEVPFESAPVVGSFEALKALNLGPEELFDSWVDEKDLLFVDGQSFKRIRDRFVINYDIPALLHKNSRSTDIAVMIFRTRTSYAYFGDLVERMRQNLIAEGLISAHLHAGRAFHYSKSPFEQILDGLGYLYDRESSPVPLDQVSFCRFLREHGISQAEILGSVRNPIGLFESAAGDLVEENLFTHTFHDSYATALAKFRTIRAQILTDR